MKKLACQYAIIRFAPYVETGEFANVGVLMTCPQTAAFEFRLETKKYGRVTKFFDDLDQKLYVNTLKAQLEEFRRIQGQLNHNGVKGAASYLDASSVTSIFNEIVRPREGIIRFSEPRVTLTNNVNNEFNRLFDFYVGRNFLDKESPEARLEKSIKNLLKGANLSNRFRKLPIGDSNYHATFPFVEQDDKHSRAIKIIKPMHFTHQDASQLKDHGGLWLFKINELKRHGTLPKKTLFSLKGPDQNRDDRFHSAYEQIRLRLLNAGVEVIDHKEKDRILKFASSAA